MTSTSNISEYTKFENAKYNVWDDNCVNCAIRVWNITHNEDISDYQDVSLLTFSMPELLKNYIVENYPNYEYTDSGMFMTDYYGYYNPLTGYHSFANE